MYQQNGAAYGGDGATKMSGAGMGGGAAGGGGAGGGMGGSGPMNGSFGSGAFGSGYGNGYGAGGYNGAAAFGGSSMYGAIDPQQQQQQQQQQGFANGSMYGGGSMYGAGAPGSMMGAMNNEEIIVTKLFSSRRDLDHVASAREFSRRFDSNWGSFRSAGADGLGGSLYGANSAAGASLMDMSEKPTDSSTVGRGTGAAGMGPDGNDGRSSRDSKPIPEAKNPAAAKAALAKDSSTTAAAAPSGSRATTSRSLPPLAASGAEAAKTATAAKATTPSSSKPSAPAAKPLSATDASANGGKGAPANGTSKGATANGAGKGTSAPTESAKEAASTPATAARAKEAAAKEAAKAAAAPKGTAATPSTTASAAPAKATEAGAAKAKPLSAEVTKPRGADPLDDIPLLAEDVQPKPKAQDAAATTPAQRPAQEKAATPATATAGAGKRASPQELTATAAAKAATPRETKAAEPASAAEGKSKESDGAALAATESAAAPAATAPPQTAPTGRGAAVSGEARHGRPRSRPATRPVSRLTSMSVIEFPEAEEVKDEMVVGGLRDPEKEARDAAVRAEQRREREAAARAAREERQRQRQLLEDAQKEREEEGRRRRQEKDDEERQRREMVAKMDEERKRERDAALAARERQREEDKRRFEEMKREEEEKEAARAAALVAERQRKLEAGEAEAQEKPSRSASRPRSRRPTSRPGSGLRGAIPEQPPDVVAGQMEDMLADDTLGKPAARHGDGRDAHSTDARRAGGTPADTRRPAEGRGDAAARPQRSQVPPPPPPPAAPTQERASPAAASSGAASRPSQARQPTPAEIVVPAREQAGKQPTPASPSSQSSKNARRSQPSKEEKTSSPATRSGGARPANMVKTLVLMEETRESNRALAVTDTSITYRDQTVDVTEVKTRPEDNFNYHSSCVHDVREAVCNGFNAAVLAIDAANTAGRFDSPVWSILNRVVRALLRENSNEAGEVRPDFELTCAMGYLYRDKAKDLLAGPGADAPFTKIGVNPSPIYGPRLTNLNYDAVTDPARFEDVLTTTLSRASEDETVQHLTEGVVAAFVLIKQTRETDGKPDIYLSSLVVATAGDDTFPYRSAISHTRNEYATVFHLVLGGPSCTCFMLNIADNDLMRKTGDPDAESVPDAIERVLELLRHMSTLQNYDLRSGSVKRFIKYVELSHASAQARLEREVDEASRRKVERYLREQERLLQDAYRLLEEAHIKYRDEL